MTTAPQCGAGGETRGGGDVETLGLRQRGDARHPLAGEAGQLRHVRRALLGGATLDEQLTELVVGTLQGFFGAGPLLSGGLNPLVQLVHVAHSDTPICGRATPPRIVNASRERYSRSHESEALPGAPDRPQRGLARLADERGEALGERRPVPLLRRA